MSLLPLITHPAYSFDFPVKHRFPMQKFRLLHEYLKTEGVATAKNTFRPGRAKQGLLAMAHCEDYLRRFCNNQMDSKELRRLGLPWSEGLVKRTLISPAGTLLAAHYALQYGLACHLAGGTHHAHYDFGSGFCVLNDLAVTAKALVNTGRVKRVLIFDCDVHQGDGTATIVADTDAIFSCSIHCEKNFPARKARSDLDVEIAKGTEDLNYLSVVESTLVHLLGRFKPDLVLYDAGVDVYEHDPLGLLNISLAGIAERDRIVLSSCLARSTPVATVIGGGYDRDQKAVAKRHAIAVTVAADLFRR